MKPHVRGICIRDQGIVTRWKTKRKAAKKQAIKIEERVDERGLTAKERSTLWMIKFGGWL